jgi:hypothetical protein
MATFNRIVVALLWLLLLAICCYAAVVPFKAIGQAEAALSSLYDWLSTWQADNPSNFIVAQATFGIIAVLIFGTLFTLEIWSGRRRGVRIRTSEGSSAVLDTDSVGRRLEWHLDQLAEVITVVQSVKSRGGSVDIRLEVETAPNIDVPMKTDEVVEVTRDILEHEMGLKLGKLDVHVRYAPFEPEWG